MFGKLIKNEIKSSAHSIGFIYIVTAILIGLFEVAYATNNTKIGSVALVLLTITGIAAIVVTFFMIIVQFNKSLFGNQGYLSFTLPVSSGQLLASKALVACFWMIASWIVSIMVITIIAFKLNTLIETSEFFGMNIKDLGKLFVSSMVGDDFSAKCLVAFFGALAVYALVVVIQLISELYFAVTLSNTRIMQKMGVFSIILTFFVVFIISSLLLGFFTAKFPLGLQINYDSTLAITKSLNVVSDNVLTIVPLGGIFFSIVSAALLFVATSLLMDSKVNIK